MRSADRREIKEGSVERRVCPRTHFWIEVAAEFFSSRGRFEGEMGGLDWGGGGIEGVL